MSENAQKNDSGKPLLSLVSKPALFGLAEVLTFGAQKYSADNWRNGFAWRRLINSLLRHGLEFSDGSDVDPESGLPVIDHVGCCWMFLSEAQKRGQGTDDRFKAPGATEAQYTADTVFLSTLRDRLNRTDAAVSDEFQLVSKGELRMLLEVLDRR